jgi:hypothetical protein
VAGDDAQSRLYPTAGATRSGPSTRPPR